MRINFSNYRDRIYRVFNYVNVSLSDKLRGSNYFHWVLRFFDNRYVYNRFNYSKTHQARLFKASPSNSALAPNTLHPHHIYRLYLFLHYQEHMGIRVLQEVGLRLEQDFLVELRCYIFALCTRLYSIALPPVRAARLEDTEGHIRVCVVLREATARGHA